MAERTDVEDDLIGVNNNDTLMSEVMEDISQLKMVHHLFSTW